MASTVNITIQDNLEAINLGINDSDSTVVVTIVDGSNGKDGQDGVNGQNGVDGVDGVDWSNVTVNGIGQIAGEITLTTDNIPDDTDKRYVTDAELVVIGNTSGTNTGDETAASIGAIVDAATNYTTPLDADKVGIWDTANSLFKGVTWSNIKATLKAYFDTLYKATFSENTAFNKNFGTTAGTVAAGDDSRFDKNITVASTVTPLSHTGTTTETILLAIPIPANTFKMGDSIKTLLYYTHSPIAGVKLTKMYFNDTPDLAGTPTLIRSNNTSNWGNILKSSYMVGSSTTNTLVKETTLNVYDSSVGGSGSGGGSYIIDWTTVKYLVITVTLGISTEAYTLKSASISRERP